MLPDLSALDLAFVFAAAFGAGMIDSMVGGGGLIQTPTLFAVFPHSPHTQLLGTGKLAGVGGTLSAILRFSRSVRIPWGFALPAAVAGFFGSLGGTMLTMHISSAVFRPLVPVMMTAVFLYVLRRHDFGQLHSPTLPDRRGVALAVLGGGVIGLYDGFFGPGTGTFLVFFFVRTFALDFLHSSAAAKIVNVAANAASLILFGFSGDVIWLLGAAMMTFNVTGSVIGSHLALRHGSRFVRKIFLIVVSILIAKNAWDALNIYLYPQS
jgi:uncharacterized membrane protein YfcA